jgi:pantothenate kinase
LQDPPLNPNNYLELLKEARELLKFKGFREKFDVVKQDPFYKEIAQDEKIIGGLWFTICFQARDLCFKIKP